jgi:hypothetical protein
MYKHFVCHPAPTDFLRTHGKEITEPQAINSDLVFNIALFPKCILNLLIKKSFWPFKPSQSL